MRRPRAARRASGREAAIRNFYFVLSKEMAKNGESYNALCRKSYLFYTISYFANGAFLDERLAGIAGDLFANGIAQANDFVPAGRSFVLRLGQQRR